MKNRNPFAVALLPFITFGIYGLVWSVKTKNEMNKLGAQIPTAWLMIVPLVNIWWLWKYSEGVEKVSAVKMSTIMAFVLQFLLGMIGNAIIQDTFNHVGENAAASAPVADTPYPQTYAAAPEAAAPNPQTYASTPTPAQEAYAPAPGFGGPIDTPVAPTVSQDYQPNVPAPVAPTAPFTPPAQPIQPTQPIQPIASVNPAPSETETDTYTPQTPTQQ